MALSDFAISFSLRSVDECHVVIAKLNGVASHWLNILTDWVNDGLGFIYDVNGDSNSIAELEIWLICPEDVDMTRCKIFQVEDEISVIIPKLRSGLLFDIVAESERFRLLNAAADVDIGNVVFAIRTSWSESHVCHLLRMQFEGLEADRVDISAVPSFLLVSFSSENDNEVPEYVRRVLLKLKCPPTARLVPGLVKLNLEIEGPDYILSIPKNGQGDANLTDKDYEDICKSVFDKLHKLLNRVEANNNILDIARLEENHQLLAAVQLETDLIRDEISFWAAKLSEYHIDTFSASSTDHLETIKKVFGYEKPVMAASSVLDKQDMEDRIIDHGFVLVGAGGGKI